MRWKRSNRTDCSGQDDWVNNKSRDMLVKNRGRKYVSVSTSYVAPVATISPSPATTTAIVAAATATGSSTPLSQQGLDQRNVGFATKSRLYNELYNGEDWKPRVIICERGLPHGFCIGT